MAYDLRYPIHSVIFRPTISQPRGIGPIINHRDSGATCNNG